MKRRKVFGIGLGKTGTTTLGACLQQLGYRHFGWHEGFAERVHALGADEAFRVADAHDSFDDFPWPWLYRELDVRYPDARFVLTVRRDAESWFRSLAAHARRVGPTAERRIAFGCDRPEAHREHVIARYQAHNRAARDYFAGRPEKLLEVCWESGSGWRELCAFLDEPVPDRPLPHANPRPAWPLVRLLARLTGASRR